MESTNPLHLNAGINIKTMKLSTFTLGALLAGALNAGAQSAQQSTIPTDSTKKAKTPNAQITEKYHQSGVGKEATKTPEKKHKKRYCPTCGRG